MCYLCYLVLLPCIPSQNIPFFPAYKRTFKEADVEKVIQDELNAPSAPSGSNDLHRVEEYIFDTFEVRTSTQLQFVSNTVQRIVHMRSADNLQYSSVQGHHNGGQELAPFVGDGVMMGNNEALSLTQRQNLVLTIRQQTEAMEALLAVQGMAWERNKKHCEEARDEQQKQQLAEQMLQAKAWEQRKREQEAEQELMMQRQTMQAEGEAKQQQMQYRTASAFLDRLLQSGMRNKEALREVVVAFPQVQNHRESRILDELQWLVRQMITTGVLGDNRYFQLNLDMTKQTWRRVLLDLTHDQMVSHPPAHKRARSDAIKPHKGEKDDHPEITRMFHRLMFEVGDIYYCVYAVLQQHGGPEPVALFCHVALLPDCLVPTKGPKESATCMLMAHKLLYAAQHNQGLQGMLDGSTRCLADIFASCALWCRTTTTVARGSITVDVRNNPIVAAWVGDPYALFLIVLRHLVVCKSSKYIDYVSPLHNLRNLPDHIKPDTLREFLDDTRSRMQKMLVTGVPCTVSGIPGLESQMVHLYTPSARLPWHQWQRGIGMRDNNSHYFPWALGYAEAGVFVSSCGVSKMSLASLGFRTAPGPEAYSHTELGWYISQFVGSIGGSSYGVISADPLGGPGMAFIHQTLKPLPCGDQDELLADMVLPIGQRNIPKDTRFVQQLMEQGFGIILDSPDVLESAMVTIDNEMPCAMHLRLDAFDVRNAPWRVHPQHPTMCQMHQVFQDFIALGRDYPDDSYPSPNDFL